MNKTEIDIYDEVSQTSSVQYWHVSDLCASSVSGAVTARLRKVALFGSNQEFMWNNRFTLRLVANCIIIC